jgi:hypothetical protein
MGVENHVMLDILRQQLNWIEREILLLRKTLEQLPPQEPPPTFESLRGVWAGVVFDAEDLQASRLTLPEDL